MPPSRDPGTTKLANLEYLSHHGMGASELMNCAALIDELATCFVLPDSAHAQGSVVIAFLKYIVERQPERVVRQAGGFLGLVVPPGLEHEPKYQNATKLQRRLFAGGALEEPPVTSHKRGFRTWRNAGISPPTSWMG